MAILHPHHREIAWILTRKFILCLKIHYKGTVYLCFCDFNSFHKFTSLSLVCQYICSKHQHILNKTVYNLSKAKKRLYYTYYIITVDLCGFNCLESLESLNFHVTNKLQSFLTFTEINKTEGGLFFSTLKIKECMYLNLIVIC